MPLAATIQGLATSVSSDNGAVPLRVTTTYDPAPKPGGRVAVSTESNVMTSSPSVSDSVHVILMSSSVAAVPGVNVLESGS